MVGTYYFVIVGHNDNPLFEADFYPASLKTDERRREDSKHLNQFIAHAALNPAKEQAWRNNLGYLKIVDKFNEWFISAFVTASQIYFLMLHDAKNEDGIKQFFQEIYEVFVKYSLNPFYKRGSKIVGSDFERKSSFFARKYLVTV